MNNLGVEAFWHIISPPYALKKAFLLDIYVYIYIWVVGWLCEDPAEWEGCWFLEYSVSWRKDSQGVIHRFPLKKKFPFVAKVGLPLILSGVMGQILLHPQTGLFAEIEYPLVLC